MSHLERMLSELLIVLLFPIGAWAQEAVNLEAFLSMSPQDLETTQVKLTYLGAQREPVPTLVLTVHGHPVDWEAFEPWDDPEHDANDWVYREQKRTEPSFTVSIEELHAMIRSLVPLNLVPRGMGGEPWLSLTIVASQPTSLKGFESSLDQDLAGELFILMRGALRADPRDIALMEGQANIEAMRTLQGWGCALGLLPEAIPAKDVTGQVRVTTSGLRWNPSGGHFECTATLTNVSKQPIRGPIALVVELSPTVSLRNAHGTTCVTNPVGRGFINLPMPAETLQPGTALEVVLEFVRDQLTPVEFATKVLAGPGER